MEGREGLEIFGREGAWGVWADPRRPAEAAPPDDAATEDDAMGVAPRTGAALAPMTKEAPGSTIKAQIKSAVDQTHLRPFTNETADIDFLQFSLVFSPMPGAIPRKRGCDTGSDRWGQEEASPRGLGRWGTRATATPPDAPGETRAHA